MRSSLFALCAMKAFSQAVIAHKKTDEDKPADPETGESTIQEKTLGVLPNPLKIRHQVRRNVYR
jgi:porin